MCQNGCKAEIIFFMSKYKTVSLRIKNVTKSGGWKLQKMCSFDK